MIKNLLHNSRFWVAVKIVFLILFLFYIYSKWESISTENLEVNFQNLTSNSYFYLWMLVFVVLFGINWFTDTLLWYNVVRNKTTISFYQAFKINLVSHAVGLVTPANIGEYGIKALSFTELGKSRQSLLLTFSYRSTKSFVKLAAGLLAMYMILQSSYPVWSVLLLVALLLLCIVYWFMPQLLEWVYHHKWGRWIFGDKEVRNWHFKRSEFLKATIPASVRFLSYSAELAILVALGTKLNFFNALARSISTYSISTFIPSLSVFDPVVKTSVGDMIFTGENVGIEWVGFCITTVWFANVGFPSLIGYLLWMRMKPQTSKRT